MLPTMRDRPAPPRHEGLLAASARHRQTAMSTWARATLDRSEKLITLCAPVDTDITSWAGSGLTALTPDDLRTTTAPPVELLQRALPDGDHGLGILIRADAVITATSRATHVEIETTLARLCRDHPVSVLCVYDRNRERRRERAGAAPSTSTWPSPATPTGYRNNASRSTAPRTPWMSPARSTCPTSTSSPPRCARSPTPLRPPCASTWVA